MKGRCPVRALLVERNPETDVSQLCNQHAWALAKGAPAEKAARIFMRLVESSEDASGNNAEPRCDFCAEVQEAERVNLQEMVGQLTRRKARAPCVRTKYSRKGPCLLGEPETRRVRATAHSLSACASQISIRSKRT